MIDPDKESVLKVWLSIAKRAISSGISLGSTGVEIAADTDLDPAEINSAVETLIDSDLVDWNRSLDAAPFNFTQVNVTPRGLYEYRRIEEEDLEGDEYFQDIRPPLPVGSPYGFTDEDWEIVAECKGDPEKLYVVLGYKFDSKHYSTTSLRRNIKRMFQKALDKYNSQPDAPKAILAFKHLGAGYGEHLFNEIARDIISADIAVFDTSDRNPNVMIEMGVALTWGVRVLPIKKKGTRKPPSDISGQTYADYLNSGKEFVDIDHERKLLRMVERAVRKKFRS